MKVRAMASARESNSVEQKEMKKEKDYDWSTGYMMGSIADKK